MRHRKIILSGVLGPILYILNTAAIPTSSNTTLGNSADDTVIIATPEDPTEAYNILQNAS